MAHIRLFKNAATGLVEQIVVAGVDPDEAEAFTPLTSSDFGAQVLMFGDDHAVEVA